MNLGRVRMSSHLSLAYDAGATAPTRKFFGKNKPRDAATLQSQIYLSIMMMYLDPASRGLHYSQFVLRLSEFTRIVRHRRALVACIEIGKDVMDGAYCRALRKCKLLEEFKAGQLDADSA